MFLRPISLLCIFVLFAKGCVCQALPVNMASVTPTGKSIPLNCPMEDSNNKWFFNDNNTWIQFFEDCIVFEDFKQFETFENTPGCLLFISRDSVTLDLWTQYGCTPYNLTDTKHSVQLIITEPIACPASPLTVLAGEEFLVNCSASFSGLWAPQLTWTDSNNNIITTTNETTSQTAIYRAEYTAAPHDTDLSLTCTLSIPPPPQGSIPEDDANTKHDRSTPQLKDTNTCSTTMHVLYGPQNTTISGPGPVAAVNENYVCESDGDPAPHYEWFLVDGGGPEHVMGDTLTVQENMTGQSNHYTCRAYNTPTEQLVLNDTADIVFTVGYDETTTEEMEITTKENSTPTDDNGTPGENTPGETTPGETTPGETTPGETTPGETTPGETTPGETTPGGTTPGETTPGEATPGETTPGEATPGETTPGETTQEVSTLKDTTMEETTQEETTLEETTSAEETTTTLGATTPVDEETTTSVEGQTTTTTSGGPSTSTDSSVDSTSARSIASSMTSVTGPPASTATQPVTDPPGDGDDIPIYAIVVPVVIVVVATATVATVWLLRRANCCAAQGSITL